jgi:hypothetical protein
VIDAREGEPSIEFRASFGHRNRPVTLGIVNEDSLVGRHLLQLIASVSILAGMGVEGGTEDEGMAGIYLTRVPR